MIDELLTFNRNFSGCCAVSIERLASCQVNFTEMLVQGSCIEKGHLVLKINKCNKNELVLACDLI